MTTREKSPPPQHQNASIIQNRWFSFDICARLWDFENPSCAYLRISQSVNNCHCTCIADWKLYGQLPSCDAPIRMNNAIGELQHVWAGGCGRAPRPRAIMQLRFSTSWSLKSLNLESSGASFWLHNFHTQHTNVCEYCPHCLSPPLRIQLQLVVCDVCHTQTPFSQTTTAAISVRLPYAYTPGAQ